MMFLSQQKDEEDRICDVMGKFKLKLDVERYICPSDHLSARPSTDRLPCDGYQTGTKRKAARYDAQTEDERWGGRVPAPTTNFNMASATTGTYDT
jgi:hypothetical protein